MTDVSLLDRVLPSTEMAQLRRERDLWKELAELQAQVLPGDAVGVEWEMVQRMEILAAELMPAEVDPKPELENDDAG